MSEWARTRWIRLCQPSGESWCETSSPSDIANEVNDHPDWPAPQRLYTRTVADPGIIPHGSIEHDWRDITPGELAEDVMREAEFYRRADIRTHSAPDWGWLERILQGIDECEEDNGWWPTSVGAEFGAHRLQALKDAITERYL